MSQTSSIASVLEQFPNQWDVIVKLRREDADFRELCEHFVECEMVLERLRAETPLQPARIQEYETLQRELEQEIRCVVRHPPHQPPRQNDPAI